jgi:hypothetical protein
MALVIDVWNEDQDTGDVYGAGRYILYFYSDSAGTIPIDVSTIGLSCNYHTHETFWGGVLDGDHAAACSGISTTIYNGTLENNDTTDPTANYQMEITMLAGTGYSVIP